MLSFKDFLFFNNFEVFCIINLLRKSTTLGIFKLLNGVAIRTGVKFVRGVIARGIS